MLRELLSNLIDNALRYTPAGGSVTVRVRARRASRPSWKWRTPAPASRRPNAPTCSSASTASSAAARQRQRPGAGDRARDRAAARRRSRHLQQSAQPSPESCPGCLFRLTFPPPPIAEEEPPDATAPHDDAGPGRPPPARAGRGARRCTGAARAALTGVLLALWLAHTFGTVFFARELAQPDGVRLAAVVLPGGAGRARWSTWPSSASTRGACGALDRALRAAPARSDA